MQLLSTHIMALLAASLALAASGCGKSSPSPTVSTAATATPATNASSNSPTGPPLTRAILIAKADPICKRVNDMRAKVRLASVSDYATKLPPLATVENQADAELRKLAPPTQMAAEWTQILVDAETIAEDTARVAGYAAANNLSRGRNLIIETTNAQEHMRILGTRDGFKDCGQNPN